MAYPAPTSLSHIHSYLHAFIEHQLCVKSLPSTDSTVRTRTEEFPQSSHSAILVANGEVGHLEGRGRDDYRQSGLCPWRSPWGQLIPSVGVGVGGRGDGLSSAGLGPVPTP